ncbi:MAG TPA: TIGR01777 family oxidoreductase [Candidatus Kapabacteria bacterium]|nr:TIGR01777 family oxidoreductase [Candidatus Kapabacteria bacterium]
MPDGTKRILITGATGLIGTHLARALAARGDEVIALVRNVDAGRRRVPEAARHLSWSSGSTGGEWANAMDGADAVVNLAGAPIAKRWTQEHKRIALESRTNAARNIIAAMASAKAPPPVLVNASAVGYYGTSETEVFTESSPPGHDYLATTCAAWEEAAVAAETLGTRVARIRIGIVLDNREGALGRLLLPYRLFVGGPVAPGTQWFPWVHVEDVVRLITWAIDTPGASGPFNAVAPGIVRHREFSRTLGRVLHRPAFLTVPQFVIRLILGEGALMLTEGQNVRAERPQAAGFRFAYPELTAALQNLLK